MALSCLIVLGGCSSHAPPKTGGPRHDPASADEIFQTDVDRMATLSMQANLDSLYLLMHKLYRRNPREWHKTGQNSAATAEAQVKAAIRYDMPLPVLGGRKSIAALSHVLKPDFRGDRVGVFVYALASMLIAAHDGRTEFFLTDTLEAEHIYNAARNIEKAVWMLAQRKDSDGRLLLLSNEISSRGRNLSFAIEFAKIVARLDLLAQVLDERYRRLGVNYAHSLLFINFLPVQ